MSPSISFFVYQLFLLASTPSLHRNDIPHTPW